MPWFEKVFQKDSKSVQEKIEERMKALNQKTSQRQKDAELKKKLYTKMDAIDRKTLSTKRDECNANRRRRLGESDDSDDVMLPSMGGEEDYERLQKGFDEKYLSKNDQYAPTGSSGYNRPNDRLYGPSSGGGQQACSHSGEQPRPYMPLRFIHLDLPRK